MKVDKKMKTKLNYALTRWTVEFGTEKRLIITCVNQQINLKIVNNYCDIYWAFLNTYLYRDN